MQSSRGRDLGVGLFVMLGLLAVAYLSVQVGGLAYKGSGGMLLSATFEEIGGLKERAPVRVSGVTVGQVEYGDAPERLVKGMPRYPVPIMILARLAVASMAQGRGLGAGLLRDAMLRTVQAADIAGIRAFVTHAKNDQARAFYEHFDFVPLVTDPYHLYCLIKDIRRFTAD